jgi:hypothetical protein
MENFRILSDQEYKEEIASIEQQATAAIQKTEQALGSIDHGVLKDIFFEILTPAKAEDAWEGFIPASSVHVVYDKNVRSRGRFSSQVDGVDEAHIILNAEKIGKAREEDFDLAVLYTYVHEQVHALSTDFKMHRSYDDSPDRKFVGFKGIKKHFTDKEGVVNYAELNEGMTEIIAEEVAREYLRRTGQVSGKHRDVHHADNSIAVYMEYKILVDDIVSELAQEYSQPTDIIKKAIIRAYFGKKSPDDNFTDWLEKNHTSLAEKAENIS